MSTTTDALKVVALGSGVGGALGGVGAAVNGGSVPADMLRGAVGGAALTALGGLIVALVSSKNRDEALQVAGLGLGASIIGQLL